MQYPFYFSSHQFLHVIQHQRTVLCSSDIGHNPGITRKKKNIDADDWSADAGTQIEALSMCTSSDGDDLSRTSIGTDICRNLPPRSKQYRRRTSKMSEPGSSRHRTQYTCDYEERDRLSERVHHHRKFQDSPHVRRFSVLR